MLPVAQAVGNGVCELVPREVELRYGAQMFSDSMPILTSGAAAVC